MTAAICRTPKQDVSFKSCIVLATECGESKLLTTASVFVLPQLKLFSISES
jgi:hypothetical protein